MSDGPCRSERVEQDLLRALLESTAAEVGEGFFRTLVAGLARALGTAGAWVTECSPAAGHLSALAFRFRDGWIEDYAYPLAGTPCEVVIAETRLVHVAERVIELFPADPDLPPLGAVSYMGLPLMDHDGAVLGHLAVLDTRPMPADPRLEAVFRIFGARAAAELRRLRAERDLREREEQLARLVGNAMDAVVELDLDLRVRFMNPAAEALFGFEAGQGIASDFAALLTEGGAATLRGAAGQLAGEGAPRSAWVPGGLKARGRGGEPVTVEASLARYELRRRPHLGLILRDVDALRRAEERILRLTAEAESLRDELSAHRGGVVIGDSPPMRAVLEDVAQVGPTGATVLLLGETGSGKEVFARAVHQASARRERPLVVVNCAAIPGQLLESELFGHEKGAFTGATARRAGRFALAHQGTIFLDEVGELPLDLQAKLLRFLQEGELEPVGSATTVQVDARVVAATNRDLEREVREGRFREDLFYRLNVFPIRLPPLRERGEDLRRLAQTFVERAARRLGRRLLPLTPEELRRLGGYAWPGNVRELENVIERAAITARDGRLDLDRALPPAPAPVPGERGVPCAAPGPVAGEPGSAADEEGVLTAAALQEFERRNMVRALERCGWRVAGEGGAARLLGLPASTLSSRMKALGVTRSPR